MNVIEANALTRYYRAQRGVRDLDLTVPAGCVLGLLGENGSGKSTALKLAIGALVPDRGAITTLGEDPARMTPATRARIGFVAERMDLPARMTLADAMQLQACYFPAWNPTLAADLLRRFELAPPMVYKALSHGQRRRAILALVIAQQPDLLILDEPTGGLDVAVRRQFLDLLVELATERQITIVLSSHILTDVERVVDHVAFIKHGRTTATGNLEELRARVKRLIVTTPYAEGLIRDRFHVLTRREEPGAIQLVVEDFDPARLNGADALIEHLNLEELFLVFNTPEPKSEEVMA